MTPLLLLLLACPQQRIAPIPEPADWIEVPAFVVQELGIENGSWMAEEGWRKADDELRFEFQALSPGAVEIPVTGFNGFYGDDLCFRLTCSDAGEIGIQVGSSWHTDVGGVGSGPNTDLHGDVLVEKRSAGARAPLRVAFRLHGIEVGFGQTVSPVLTEGALELSLEFLDWSRAISAPGLQSAREVPEEQLSEVSTAWPDGKPRSHGWLDPTGRRQGVWSTWTSRGTKQSESRFRNGEREGRWVGFWEDGRLYEAGDFANGIREGKWIEQGRNTNQITTNSGHYVAGEKSGEWLERWEDGTLKARGAYMGGRRSGLWTRWWQNGNKHTEGPMVQGWPEGEWTYWNEDGSVESVTTKKRLGFQRY